MDAPRPDRGIGRTRGSGARGAPSTSPPRVVFTRSLDRTSVTRSAHANVGVARRGLITGDILLLDHGVGLAT